MSGVSVVVLVDLLADRFITGIPRRVSREAPVLILRESGDELIPGGGGNVIRNLVALRGKVLPVGILGEDRIGDKIAADLEALGIDLSGILRKRGYRTPTKTRVLAGSTSTVKQQIVRYDSPTHVRLTARDRAKLTSSLSMFAQQATIALVSDYGYGGVVPSLVNTLREALKPSAKIVCDSRYRLRHFKGLDVATPNEEEAAGLLGTQLPSQEAPLARAAQKLVGQLVNDFILLTRGSLGMLLATGDEAWRIPVHGSAQVADVTGAGDTVLATAGLAMAAGADPLETAILATYAAGEVVTQMGTATTVPADLARAISTDPAPIRGSQRIQSN